MSVCHILHRFLICFPSALSHWSCMSLCCAPWKDGRWGEGKYSRAKTIPKEAGLSKCSEDAGSFQQLAQTSELKFELSWKRPNSSEGLTGFLPKVSQDWCWGGPQTSSGFHKVTSNPTTAAFLPFISSSCCVEASSSSSGSSRRVSPGRAAGPDHPALSSPVCGAAWTSWAHGGTAPSLPETQEHKTAA